MNIREEIRSQLGPFGLSLGVHALMALLVVLGTVNWKPFREPRPVGLTIEAVIVDTSAIVRQREEAERAAAEAEQRREAEERRARELEAQRQRERAAELQRQQQAEEERQRAAAEQRRQQAAEEERRRREAQDRLQQLRLERERKLEEERLKQQRELEQIREQREAAERARKRDEERLKQIQARQQAEAAEKQRQAAAEQKAAQAGRIASLEDEYEAAIRSIVTQNWLRPPTARPGLRCTLRIVQIPGGEIISAAIAGACNGDEVTRRSIVAAVERIDALPYRGYEDVFKREIEFIFIYDGD